MSARLISKDERGQTTILIVGFAVVLLMAIGMVVDASAAYLHRQSLATLADGAALAGADQLQGETAYQGGLGEYTPIDETTARRTVRQHLREVGAYDAHPGLRVDVEVVADRVVVRLVAPLELPFRVDGLTDTEVGASGAARVTVEERSDVRHKMVKSSTSTPVEAQNVPQSPQRTRDLCGDLPFPAKSHC